MKIVVVDESEDFRSTMRDLLRDAGYEDILLLPSGRELLRSLAHGDSSGAPLHGVDLIVMAVAMPRLDGIATLRALRSRPEYEDIPVLMVAERVDEAFIETAFDAGATDYLSKPIRSHELRARIVSALRLRREMGRRKAHEEDLAVLNGYLKRANDELRRLSCIDSLCLVANRRTFEEALIREWNRGKRAGTSLAIAMIDVDHFKEYNDEFGHLAGDHCLVRVCKALSGLIMRSSDVLARFGGEEFVALLVGASTAGALALCETMRGQVESLGIPHASNVRTSAVTISVGLACTVPCGETSAWALLRSADDALYTAKREGRNRVCLAGPA